MVFINGRGSEFNEDDPAMEKLRMYTQSIFASRVAGVTSPNVPPLPRWDMHKDGRRNTFRLGEVSTHGLFRFWVL